MVDKRPIGYIPGKGNPLDKKPPKTNKYDYVQGTLKTGTTIKDINIMSDQAVAKRKNELFKRIKTSTLSNLLKQDRNFESIYQLGEENKDQQQYVHDNMSLVSNPISINSQATYISAVTYATENLGITDNTCFLLLDTREPEDFELYHIKESINLPAPNISRDKFIPAVYRFKNQPDKLIIIYHSDERNGIPIAQKLAEKGFENVFLLSGGIEKFVQEYPEELDGKKIPVIKKQDEDNKSRVSVAKSQISQVSNAKSQVTNKSQISQMSNAKSQITANSKLQASIQQKSTIGKSDIQSTIQKRSASVQKPVVSKSNTPSHIGGQNTTPNKINKRSNYKEYPEMSDVFIKKDLQNQKEIQNIITNSQLKQSQAQMSPIMQNDSMFSNNESIYKK
ncbi:rhodanese-like domain protein (macronuclear) [Tetrahymena thermophila SB210]|uniref:Rhodanese-like domain protein n=1 Tax=Tetrahymena thermophila (strain SB210) TaxID=312017 RepID=I7LWI9_TETTS|nr:rhodanese-like domain protein [Tetrahymena thermophila SB210]EAS01972.2 rhodanese-like domain protein [Tetrahymena thermophila SB210]|eukprot:XP_001022217.2 rhodanese-like domain protein [Tetrahymena thermophila SB210]